MIERITKEVYSATSHEMSQLLQKHTARLSSLIAGSLNNVANELYSKGLITLETRDKMFVIGLTDNEKASQLTSALQRQLEGHFEPDKYLINVCDALITIEDHLSLVELANTIK